MKIIYKTNIALIVLFCVISIVQIANSQVYPKYIFKHTDVNGYVGGLAFSHDLTKLITTGGQHAMMWDLITGQKVMTFPPYSGYYAIDFSQDDKKIVTNHVNHATVAIWDAQTGDEIKTIQGEIDSRPPSWYTAVTFSRDGESILCGDENGSLYVIDINQEKVVQKFKYLGGYMDNIQTFPDGNRVLASLSIVSLQTGEIIHKIDKSHPFLSYDGSEIYAYDYVTSNHNEQYIPVVLNADNLVIKRQYSSFSYIPLFDTSPNGRFIAVAGKEKVDSGNKVTPQIFNLISNREARTIAVEGVPDNVFDMVKFSRDGNMVAFVKGDTVYLYDISDLTSGVKESESIKN